MKTVLTIAGSDPSGGAGIQADLKTMCAHKVYGMSVLTALTAQNTMGVSSVVQLSPQFITEQLDRVFEDIFPDAVKIGMLGDKDAIHAVAQALKTYRPPFVVLDPVMVSTSGSSLLNPSATNALITELVPLCSVITPNIPEAQILSGQSIHTKEDMQAAGRAILSLGAQAVLIKGGHGVHDADDVLVTPGGGVWLCEKRVDNPNTHGTGCTLSSAIACNLAKGESLEQSVRLAKAYLTGALKQGLNLGRGPGPLDHLYNLKEAF